MRSLIVYIISLIFLSNLLISQEYRIIRKGESQDGTFYPSLTKFDIKKGDLESYLDKVFYVKSKNSLDSLSFETKIMRILQNNGYRDLSIKKISKPFDKFIRPQLLSSKNSNIENIYLVEIENNFDVFDLCTILSENDEFEYAVPSFTYSFTDFRPNDEQLTKQYYLDSIDIFRAWDIAKGNKSIIIGIVDSGVDWIHEDLVSQVWTNQAEIPNDGIDNDGNGFIDDVHGWDFVGDISPSDALRGKFQEDNNPIPNHQSNSHGTHVAGISSATTNNSVGIASTGFDVTFIPIKIGLDNLTSSSMVYRPYEGMLYAAYNGAQIINCSWSSEIHDPLAYDVINEILEMGVVIVAANGNDNIRTDKMPYYPAMYDGVIAVGSYGQNGEKASNSNYGIKTNCYAPGVNIFSTINNNDYNIKSGTSMASPVVSGFIANMKLAFPNYNSKQIAQQIRSTTSDFNTPSIYLHGKLNCYDALKYNNPNYPNLKVGGVEVEEILIADAPQIEKYESTTIKLKLVNFLSDLKDIHINLSPQDNYFQLSQNSFDIEEIKSGEAKYLALEITIHNNCPWFDGDLSLLVNITAENNYKNNQLINIPFSLESNNKYFLAQTFNGNYIFDWRNSVSNSLFDYWAVGYDLYNKNGVMYNLGKFNDIRAISKDTLQDISVQNNTVYIVSNSRNNEANLLKSTNLANSFTTIPLSNYFYNVSSIYFNNANEGIITGLGVDNKGKIFYTNDGANSFIEIERNELSNNEYYSSRIKQRNTKIIYLGTSHGRILYSEKINGTFASIKDSKALKIIDIAPISKDTIIYFAENVNKQKFLRITKDNGAIFDDISTSNIEINRVVNLFIPDSSNSIYIMLNTGELYVSDDLGKSWHPELNSQRNYFSISNSNYFLNGGRVRLWLAGGDINFLEFDLNPTNKWHNLDIAGKYQIDFDSTEINSFQDDIIFLENKGNVKEILDEQALSISEEFEIVKKFKNQISSLELISSTIRYKPESKGAHFDTLTIKSNSAGVDLKFELSGFSYDPTSVYFNDDIEKSEIELFSTSETYEFLIKSNNDTDLSIRLYDNLGKLIYDYGNRELNYGENRIILNKFDLNSGLYVFNLFNQSINYLIKIIVIE